MKTCKYSRSLTNFFKDKLQFTLSFDSKSVKSDVILPIVFSVLKNHLEISLHLILNENDSEILIETIQYSIIKKKKNQIARQGWE